MLKLTKNDREILYLHYYYGYSFNEISNLLSISVDAAKKRAQRARSELKKMIEKGGYFDGK